MLAITLSSHLLAREEENKTIELILARPVSRLRFWISKLIAGFIVLAAVGSVSLIATIICLKSSHYDIAISRVVAATIMTLILSLLFGSVAWAVNGLGRFGRRASLGIAWLVLLASYLFTSLEGFANWLRWPAKLLPYHYYQPSSILNGQFTWANAIGMVIASLIILTVGYLGFRQRDIA
jgi:ABC-2 type transport system permease protein